MIQKNEKYQHLTGQTGAEWSSIGKCRALYDFTSDQNGELNMKEGDNLLYIK